MSRQSSETEGDLNNVEAWAMLFEEILSHVRADPCDVLTLALKKQQEEAEKDAELAAQFIRASELEKMEFPHTNTIERLKSLLVQVFVRDISIDHSPEEAHRILFGHHPHGRGSGDLGDYLEGLESKRRRPKQAYK
jgi:hypothetical protein